MVLLAFIPLLVIISHCVRILSFHQEICYYGESIPIASFHSTFSFCHLFSFLLWFWKNARGTVLQECVLSTVLLVFFLIITLFLQKNGE